MKHFVIDEHTEICINRCEKHRQSEDEFLRRFSVCLSKDDFLFYHDNEFFLITYNSCLSEYSNHIDYKEYLLGVFFNSYKKETYSIKRPYKLNDEMKEFRLRQKNLNLNIDEINYVYRDNAGREYALVISKDFTTFNDEETIKDYNEIKNYLSENGYSFFLKELEYLKNINLIGNRIDKKEVFKTTSELIKKINKQIKQIS